VDSTIRRVVNLGKVASLHTLQAYRECRAVALLVLNLGFRWR